MSQVFGYRFCHQQPLQEETRAQPVARSGPWGGRTGEQRALTPKAKASAATWVMILAAPRVNETLLLFPHCLTSWVATSPGRRGSVKHCVIKRGKAGLGRGQEERARRTRGRKSGPRYLLTPQHRAAPWVPASFPLPTQVLPCSVPFTSQSPAELGACCCHAGWDMGPSHRFKPTHSCACTCSFVHRQWREESQCQLFPGFTLCFSSLAALLGSGRGRQPGTQAMSRGGGGGGGCSGQGCWLVLWVSVVIDQCGKPEPECPWGKLVLSGAAWMFSHL